MSSCLDYIRINDEPPDRAGPLRVSGPPLIPPQSNEKACFKAWALDVAISVPNVQRRNKCISVHSSGGSPVTKAYHRRPICLTVPKLIFRRLPVNLILETTTVGPRCNFAMAEVLFVLPTSCEDPPQYHSVPRTVIWSYVLHINSCRE